jgi:hypothetical protein
MLVFPPFQEYLVGIDMALDLGVLDFTPTDPILALIDQQVVQFLFNIRDIELGTLGAQGEMVEHKLEFRIKYVLFYRHSDSPWGGEGCEVSWVQGLPWGMDTFHFFRSDSLSNMPRRIEETCSFPKA